MQRPELPEEILRFIDARIDSVPHLESLLLFWENPTVSWAEPDIAARVYVSRELAQTILRDLSGYGFIVPAAALAGSYLYNPAWDEGGLMESLAVIYRRHLVYLARRIHEKATLPVRCDGA